MLFDDLTHQSEYVLVYLVSYSARLNASIAPEYAASANGRSSRLPHPVCAAHRLSAQSESRHCAHESSRSALHHQAQGRAIHSTTPEARGALRSPLLQQTRPLNQTCRHASAGANATYTPSGHRMATASVRLPTTGPRKATAAPQRGLRPWFGTSPSPAQSCPSQQRKS